MSVNDRKPDILMIVSDQYNVDSRVCSLAER